MNSQDSPDKDCREAIAMGVRLLQSGGIILNDYKLISAENLVKGPNYAGPQTWRLTFKTKSSIPATADSEVGAGGEIFVEVDLSTQTTKLLGYGE